MAERTQNENLRPLGDGSRTKDEEREIRAAGGRKSGEVRRLKAREQKEWADLLKMTLREGKAEKLRYLNEAEARNIRVSVAMKVKLINDALNGDKKAHEMVLKYAGITALCDLDEEMGEDENDTPQMTSLLTALEGTAEEVFKDEPTDKTTEEIAEENN